MARRQEQEDATTDVVEVAPNVLRLQLPIQFTGLGHVNMYTLLDDRGAAVVDPGLPGGGSWKAIADRLRRAGLTVDDVHTVVVTHSHPDHFGGAGRLAHEAGAEIVAHAGFKVPWLPETFPDVVTFDDDGFPEDVPEDADRARAGAFAAASPSTAAATGNRPQWGGGTKWNRKSFMPSLPKRLALRTVRRLRPNLFRPPVPTRRVSDGERVRLAGRDWMAIHTPGHTEDHLCLHDPEHGVLIAGDHVLPTITPHISGMGSTDRHDPLDAYLVALDKVAALDVGTALPAHGHPFTDVSGRVGAIKRHHDERLDRTLEIAAELGGQGTVEEFSQRLFRERHWGLMAESETFAHLEHLRHRGMASRHDRDGEAVYVIEDPAGVPRPTRPFDRPGDQ